MIAEVVPPAGELRADVGHKLLAYFVPLWVMMGSMALVIVGLVATKP